MRKSKWLIISISLILTIGLANCGKKSSGLLLLPNLAQGEGGPQVSPEKPKGIEESTSTQQQQPSVQVIDDVVAVDTGSLNNPTSPGEPAVIEIPNNQIPRGGDNSGGNNSGDNNSGGNNSGDNNTGDVKEVPNNQIPRGGDNSGDNGEGNVIEPKPIESEPQPVIITPEESKDLQEAIKNEDVTTDPIEQVVSSDTGSNDSAISEEETQEEVAHTNKKKTKKLLIPNKKKTKKLLIPKKKIQHQHQHKKIKEKMINKVAKRW